MVNFITVIYRPHTILLITKNSLPMLVLTDSSLWNFKETGWTQYKIIHMSMLWPRKA